MIKLAESSQQAILAVMMYVQRSTGIEATQDEIAAALKTYFSLDEITNQISYLRRKPPEPAEAQAAEEVLPPRHRFNLAGGRPGNNLARAGYFIEEAGKGPRRRGDRPQPEEQLHPERVEKPDRPCPQSRWPAGTPGQRLRPVALIPHTQRLSAFGRMQRALQKAAAGTRIPRKS
ncbi:MAG: hypothetical protein MUF46_08560 [Desulfobacterales bacterium]|nr:hypothetical protein [Desulfobacterales bacterium]